MKKGKVFGKSHIALAVMVVALAGAIWLNMSYSNEKEAASDDTSSKYLGQAEYVNNELVDGEESSDPSDIYFSRLRSNRIKNREEAIALIEDSLENSDLSQENKKQALDTAAELAKRSEKEAAIESLLSAKGFSASVAVIGDEDVNVIVKASELLPAQTVQVQDVVLSQTDFSLAQIKIVAVPDDEIEKAVK